MKKIFSKPPEPKEPQSSVAQSQEALELARQLAQHPAVQKLFSAWTSRYASSTARPNDRYVWATGTSKYDRPADMSAMETPNEGTSDEVIAFLHKALEKEILLIAPKPTGVAFQKALADHSMWGQYPIHLRPKSPEQMNDINLLRKAQSWQRRKELLPPLDENHPRRVTDLPEEERPKIYRPIKCQTCQDQKVICRGWLDKYRRHIVPCPDCIVKERERRKKVVINHYWRIDELNQELANMPWINGRIGAVAADRARAAQQQIMEEMPSRRTLFLYGVASVGKSRLLAEIALVARQRGLSSILKTAKRIKEIRLFEVLWGVTSIQLLVILSFALNLGLQDQIPRYPRNDRRVLPHNSSESQKSFKTSHCKMTRLQ